MTAAWPLRQMHKSKSKDGDNSSHEHKHESRQQRVEPSC